MWQRMKEPRTDSIYEVVAGSKDDVVFSGGRLELMANNVSAVSAIELLLGLRVPLRF